MGNGTISQWRIEMEKAGLAETSKSFFSDKRKDYEGLKQSGLPVFDDFVVPFEQFEEGNEKLKRFLSQHEGFVVRAIPKMEGLPRRYKIGVHNFSDCQNFLHEIQRKDRSKYLVFLTEYEPTDWGGIIISRPQNIFIEVSEDGLDKLSHGQVIPIGEYLELCDYDHFKKIENNASTSGRVMWSALEHLIKDSPTAGIPNLMKGYFEFVRTQRGKIKFLDYKTNEAYLK